ncbi:MAG TPA: response regulator [Candidatus Acidoferrum sp.]|nr:response regulator [Candidatus Acidoferrum sp.]
MKTIYFIEDDPVVVKVYGAKFQREGFRVEVAEDGLAALKNLLKIKPDIVLLDLMMPKFNGVDVLKYIRSTPELQKTPVIILSNAHMTALAQEAAAFGAEKALLKSSCTPSILLEAINNLLRGAEADSNSTQRLAAPKPPSDKPPS